MRLQRASRTEVCRYRLRKMNTLMGKFFNGHLSVQICAAIFMIGFFCLVITGTAPQAQAQSSTTTARTPGTPAGSYKLGDADTVNLFTGNLNYTLPLLGVGGRGGAQSGLNVVLEAQWDRKETLQDGYLQVDYSLNQVNPLAFVGSVK